MVIAVKGFPLEGIKDKKIANHSAMVRNFLRKRMYACMHLLERQSDRMGGRDTKS